MCFRSSDEKIVKPNWVKHLNGLKGLDCIKVIRSHTYKFAMVPTILILVGCATLPRNPVPLEVMDNAVIHDSDLIRTWSGEFNPRFQSDIIQSVYDQHQASSDKGLYLLKAVLHCSFADDGL